MKLLKKLKTFNSLIFLVVLSFTAYQVFSLISIDIIYVHTNIISQVLYVLASILLLILTSLVVYFFPVVTAIEIYKLSINIKTNITFNYKVSNKIVLNSHIIVDSNRHKRLMVNRC